MSDDSDGGHVIETDGEVAEYKNIKVTKTGDSDSSIVYAKIPRDALLIIIFSQHAKSILEIYEILKAKDFEPMRTSGSRDKPYAVLQHA